MSVVQFDLQKIEQLLNSATSERQRKMYQALLDKARSQERASTDSKAPGTTPSTEKKAKTKTKGQTETKTKTETKTTKNKKKKTTPQSATTEASPTIQSTQPVTESTTQLTEKESSVSPQTELKSQSQEPQQQSDAEPPIFQAKGALIATPYVQGDRLKVAIDEREYDLSYNRGYQRRAYVSLSSELEKNGSKPMFLRVYPQATFDQSDAEPRLSFSLVNYSQDCEKINDEPKGFVLRGIWQYIPFSKSPVITIYRNRAQKEFFKRLKGSGQFNFAKPRHIPVVWDAPVEPFKFNPRAETGERTSDKSPQRATHNGSEASPSVSSQMPRYFVQVRAIFKDGLYVVEEMLGEPTRKVPKFIKVSKKQ